MSYTRYIFPLLLIGALAAAYFYFTPGTEKNLEKTLKTSVDQGEFIIRVNATGELKAKRSEKIRGPQGMRSARIYQTNITDLVPEGTIFKEG
jgi:hypothetical protein